MNLVFTSAGDNTNFDELWFDSKRGYKVWVVYYGDDDEIYEKYKSKVDYIERRKGSKFQNFYHIWKTKQLDKKFDRFFILDDDIVINTKDINNMFMMSEQCNLSICGPSFDNESKISWKVTKSVEGSVLRFTNWVEVNVPLFDKTAIKKLMDIYDESLIGWGVDYLYMWANGIDERQKFAIIDMVKCTNPKDDRKGGERELKKVKDWDKRSKTWEMFRDKNGIEEVKEKKTWWQLTNSGTGKNIFKKMRRPQPPRKQYFSGKLNFKKSDTPKIAFLFLTVGDIHKPKFWHEFLNSGVDKCNIYAHSKHRDKLGTGYLRDNQIDEHFDSFWGGPGLVLATIALLKEALKDPSNKYFVLVSESCIPLYDFNYTYDKLLGYNLSMVYHTKSRFPNYEEWVNTYINKDSPIKEAYKCSQWMGLNRKHAEIVAEKGYDTFDKSMQKVPIPDEWYIRSLLNTFDPEYEKTNLSYVRITERSFVGGASHPKTHKRVKLSDYKKKKEPHSLFLRKIEYSTKIS
jgi:hypothetical protein